jgi:fructose-1,6-bisphosphatase/sedoheptulose 1,7-bisphosphatase-like protein
MIGLGLVEIAILVGVGLAVAGVIAAVVLFALAASRKDRGDRATIARLAEENRRLREELIRRNQSPT